MSLKVAFDLDGTIADMGSALRALERRLFGDDVAKPATAKPVEGTGKPESPPEDPDGNRSNSLAAAMTRDGLTLRQQRHAWQEAAKIENFWEGFAEIERGAVRAIAEHATGRGWDVIFLTRRPATAGRTAQAQTQRWLLAKGFSLPSVFIVTGSRGKVADALGLDAVVDDLPENCVDVVSDSRAKAILVQRDESTHVMLNARRIGITVVQSIAEALACLVDLETGRRQPTVADRVKRAVGLKRK